MTLIWFKCCLGSKKAKIIAASWFGCHGNRKLPRNKRAMVLGLVLGIGDKGPMKFENKKKPSVNRDLFNRNVIFF